jgi:glycosyltransferase involved in cell wall biosynthesis
MQTAGNTLPIAANVSVVIIAKNEAANLPRCLEALRWCDDVVVVDDHSTDESPEIARQYGARVATHAFTSFAAQRNWALAEIELKYDWVVMLDADEVATPDFAMAVARAIREADAETVAFRTCRKTMFLETWLKYSDGFPVWIMRVVRRGKAWFADAGHGEVPVPPVTGRVGTISEPFLHYPFSKGLSDWLQRHIRYAEREAAGEITGQHAGSLWQLLSWQRDRRRLGLRTLSRQIPGRPLWRFLYQYLWKWGFLEGQAGFTFSMLMACYEAMILAKRVELQRKQQGQSI